MKSTMMIFLLWLALFLDVLDSFSPRQRVEVPSSSQRNAESKPSDNVKTNIKLTIPPIAENGEEGYPSPLHNIYIRSLMSREEAQRCRDISVAYARSNGRWETPDFDRHQTYATCDFPVEDCDELVYYLQDIGFEERLWADLSELYGIDRYDMEFLDFFVAYYQAKDNSGTSIEKAIMDGLELHRDGSLLSFSLLLNSPKEFTGGGTSYDALRDVEPSGILHSGGIIRPENPGDACLHCGKVLHGADTVTSGERIVLVGFIEVSELCTKPGVLAEACTQFGRMDVASHRFKRQAEKQHKGWILSNGKWLSGTSHLTGFVPAFESVLRRADPEYQRKKKLEAEDVLLREILLPEDQRQKSMLDGDITVL